MEFELFYQIIVILCVIHSEVALEENYFLDGSLFRTSKVYKQSPFDRSSLTMNLKLFDVNGYIPNLNEQEEVAGYIFHT